MQFSPPFVQATLLRRYKRFLADVHLSNGQEITVHCPNTGSMKNCLAPGEPCWISTTDNPKRKYPHTLEITTTPTGDLAGVNTGLPNKLVEEAIRDGVVASLAGYTVIKREVRYGAENRRLDLLLSEHAPQPDCYVEVKNVTLLEDEGRGYFPDAVSTRGSKHLRELITMVEAGYRAVLFFCVQHSGIEQVSPADHIDPTYGDTLRKAIAAGVEVVAYKALIGPEQIVLASPLPVIC